MRGHRKTRAVGRKRGVQRTLQLKHRGNRALREIHDAHDSLLGPGRGEQHPSDVESIPFVLRSSRRSLTNPEAA